MHRHFTLFFCLLLFPLLIHAQNNPSDTIWNQIDPSGKKFGWWKKFYPNGNLMYKGFFENDLPKGMLIRYFENGKKKAVMEFSDNGKSAYSILFYMNGERAAEGKYVETLKDSTWKYYSYYTRTLSYVENYKSGLKQGPSMKYYDNGQVAEIINWEANMKQGKWFQYFEDGSLRLSSAYLNNEMDGPYKIFTSPGKLAIDGNYKAGEMDGTWLFYDEQGTREFELIYDNGKALNDTLLEEKSRKFIEDMEKNLGTIPEPDLENFIPE